MVKKSSAAKSATDQTLTIKLSYQHLVIALVAVNVLTLFLWKPWVTNVADARKISVNGEATVEAEPDEFQFSPSWKIDSDNQDSAIDEAAQKAETVVNKLKKLGVDEKDIKLQSDSYERWWYNEEDDVYHANVYLTISVDNKDLAQEVQDYLATTAPEGQITPWPTFSDELRKELEKEARALAIEDAREKAEQSASELDSKVGKVISVSEGWGGGIYYGEDIAVATLESASDSDEARSSFEILPGENELTMNVTVVFEIK